jgi:hypothetical protein
LGKGLGEGIRSFRDSMRENPGGPKQESDSETAATRLASKS